jgi:hypothetical protein
MFSQLLRQRDLCNYRANDLSATRDFLLRQLALVLFLPLHYIRKI